MLKLPPRIPKKVSPKTIIVLIVSKEITLQYTINSQRSNMTIFYFSILMQLSILSDPIALLVMRWMNGVDYQGYQDYQVDL
jgi:hypothetical protein